MREITHQWTEEMGGRERVRAVIETLDGPLTIPEVADRADTSQSTATDELERLKRDKWVREKTVDGRRAFNLYSVRLYVDQVMTLLEEYDRRELEEQLIELTEEQEGLCENWDVNELDTFRQELAEEELTSAELRKRQNVIDTWQSIETEIDLVRQALQLYRKSTPASPR